MSQHYSDPSREKDPHALPNIEVFYYRNLAEDEAPSGWYWWACFPGCLPDGDPNGPFDTEQEAAADARDASDPDEEEGP